MHIVLNLSEILGNYVLAFGAYCMTFGRPFKNLGNSGGTSLWDCAEHLPIWDYAECFFKSYVSLSLFLHLWCVCEASYQKASFNKNRKKVCSKRIGGLPDVTQWPQRDCGGNFGVRILVTLFFPPKPNQIKTTPHRPKQTELSNSFKSWK